MRQRNTHTTRPSADPAPRQRKGKGHRQWSSRFRAYVIATALFVLVLFGYYSVTGKHVPTGHQQWEHRLARVDTGIVKEVTRQFEASPTLPFMESLVSVCANTSCIFETRLDDLTEAEEARERGDGRGRDDAPTATSSAKREMARIANALQRAGDDLYDLLEGMFLGPSDAPLHELPVGLPRSTFTLFATTLHLHAIVFPEYYLVADQELAHARSLVRSLNLLDWAATAPTPFFFNWTSNPCRKVVVTTTKKWVTFCQTSLSSPASIQSRSAVVLEELIALYPDYAPFRLHYAATLALLPSSDVKASTQPSIHPASLQAVRTARRYWGTYERDLAGSAPLSAEAAFLSVLEAYATPLENADETVIARTVAALSTLDSCEAFAALVPRGAVWPVAPFTGERRPALMHLPETRRLLMKIALVVGDKFPGAFRETYASCI